MVTSDPQRRQEMILKEVLLLGWQPACYPHTRRPRDQGPCSYRGPCRHTASDPQRSGQRSRAFAPPGRISHKPPPTPLALRLRGRAGETEAAGTSQLVMRQIHQRAAAEGVLKMLAPTLITCQPGRPNVAQKLWNKRAISYYF